MDIKIVVPSAKDKGYLRRQQKALHFAEMMKSEKPSAEMVDAMAEFVCDFVKEPQDRTAAKEAILDLSQEEFEEIIAAITLTSEVPKANGEQSATIT